MNSFSPEWLALREAADHRARNADLVSQLGAHFAENQSVKLIDLGCGTGSNLRALAPVLAGRQIWTLTDYDQTLLDEARSDIETWSDQAGLGDFPVSFEQADLNADIERLLANDATDLVTAAALFDLVSKEWIDRFIGALAERRCAFYTVLIYDGSMRWKPPHDADEAIQAAFNTHQHWDKGFGPAMGPDATDYLAERLESEGYRVTKGPSPWRLTENDSALIVANAEGIAHAVRETNLVSEAEIDSWLETRHDLGACEIGHMDLLALP